MKVSIPCPNCGSHDFNPFDDCSGIQCITCGTFVPDADIEIFAKGHPECTDVQRLTVMPETESKR